MNNPIEKTLIAKRNADHALLVIAACLVIGFAGGMLGYALAKLDHQYQQEARV